MYFLALATDYDGTLAQDERVDELTVAAIRRFKDSGRFLVLVTGRELGDVKRLFPDYVLFDSIVAENGALLYDPSMEKERRLATHVPLAVAARLICSQETGPFCVRVFRGRPHPRRRLSLPFRSHGQGF